MPSKGVRPAGEEEGVAKEDDEGKTCGERRASEPATAPNAVSLFFKDE